MNSATPSSIKHISQCIEELRDKFSRLPGDCIVFREEREESKQRHPSAQSKKPSE